MLEKTKNFNPFTIFILANIVIGTNVVAFKIATEGAMDPLLFSALRFGGAGMLLLGFIWSGVLKNPSVLWRVLLNASFIVIFLFLWSYGLDQSTAIKASFLSLTTPLMIYVMSVLFLHEKANKLALVGCLTGLLGSLMIIGLPALFTDRLVVGDVMLLVSYLFAAITIVHTKHMYRWVGPAEIVSYRFFVAGFIALAYLLIAQGSGVFTGVSLQGWVATIYGILITGLLGNVVFFWALKRIRAEDASPGFYADPLTGTVASVLILGDVLEPLAAIGVAIVILGLIISHPHHHNIMYRLHTKEHHLLRRIRVWLGGILRYRHFNHLHINQR